MNTMAKRDTIELDKSAFLTATTLTGALIGLLFARFLLFEDGQVFLWSFLTIGEPSVILTNSESAYLFIESFLEVYFSVIIGSYLGRIFGKRFLK